MKECKDQFAWRCYLLLLVEKHSKFGDQHLDHLFGMKLHKPFLLSTKIYQVKLDQIGGQIRSNEGSNFLPEQQLCNFRSIGF